MSINLKNSTGEVRSATIGISWTSLFFGFFVPLFRGDYKWALIFFFADLITFGIANIVFCFIYNGMYIRELLQKGFRPMDDFSHSTLISKGFMVD